MAVGRNVRLESKHKRGRSQHKRGKSLIKRGKTKSIVNTKHSEEKRATILALLSNIEATPKDSAIQILREFSLSRGGLIDNEIRRQVWPIILGVETDLVQEILEDLVDFENVPHKDQRVIENDVNRSLTFFSVCNDYSKPKLEEMRQKLSDNVLKVLSRNHETMHYYQGFNDVSSVHLLVCGTELGAATLEAHSKLLLKDYLAKDLGPTTELLTLIHKIVKHFDPKLFKHIEKLQLPPFYSTSWVITSLAHDIEDFELVTRIYDAFLSCHTLFPLYFAAALITHARVKQELYKLGNDFAQAHTFLKNLPSRLSLNTSTKKSSAIDIEVILAASREMMATLTPDLLL